MASTEEIRTDLAEIVNEVAGIDVDQVQLDRSFVDDLDVDSLSLVEYTMELEDAFGIELAEDELAELGTIGAFANLILTKLA